MLEFSPFDRVLKAFLVNEDSYIGSIGEEGRCAHTSLSQVCQSTLPHLQAHSLFARGKAPFALVPLCPRSTGCGSPWKRNGM